MGEREWVPSHLVEAAIAAKTGISEEQADSARHLLNRDGVSVLIGSAGSGKSWTSEVATAAAKNAGMSVWAIAPSWAATDVIRTDADVTEAMSAAVAAFLAKVANGSVKVGDRTMIVVDESGMIPTADMARLLSVARNCKIVLMGDPLQLQPVGAGAPLRSIAARCSHAEIRRIQRQQNAWQKAASERFAKGDGSAILAYDDRGFVMWSDGKDEPDGGDGAMQRLASDWAAHVASNPDTDERGRQTRLALASRNADVHRLNVLLRAEWAKAGRLSGPEFVLKSVHRGQDSAPREIRLQAGDRLVWGEKIELPGQPTINNSDGCTLHEIGGDPADPTIRIRLDKGGEVVGRFSQFVGKAKPGQEDPRMPHVQPFFCATVHQSQGRTVQNVYILNAAVTRGLSAESAYVSCTRHTKECRMYVDSSALMDRVPGGDPSLTDEQEQARVRAELRKILVEDSNRSEAKVNASDYAADPPLDSFIATGDLASVPSPAELLMRRMKRRQVSPVPTTPSSATAVSIVAIVPPTTSSSVAWLDNLSSVPSLNPAVPPDMSWLDEINSEIEAERLAQEQKESGELAVRAARVVANPAATKLGAGWMP